MKEQSAQHSTVNRQQLTPLLTTRFACITQPVAIQNTFLKLFFNNFGQWNTLDSEQERENFAKMNFPTVNHIIKKQRLHRFLFVLSLNGKLSL